MRLNFQLLLLLCIIGVTADAQNAPSLKMGDAAPPLRVSAWIKGEPVQRFERGKVYVVEFWATWCAPCIAAMPHLSALARQYTDSVTILSINIDAKKKAPLQKIKAFVDSLGQRMDYHVAVEDSNAMTTTWLDASGEYGIPISFVVNSEGKLGWIGHPKDLDIFLPKIVNKTWDITEALAKKNADKHLSELDDSLNYELMNYNNSKPGYIDKPDSALLMIKEIVTKEPGLKYAPLIATHTFSALLKTEPHKAFEYGKELLGTASFQEPYCYAIIGPIEYQSDKLTLPPEIYQLGAEAYQARIDQIPYPEILDIPTLYMKMAQWYWRAKNKSKAIEAMQKSIEALKKK